MKVREFIEKFVICNTLIKLYRLDNDMNMHEMIVTTSTEIYNYPEFYSLEVYSLNPEYDESSKNILCLIVNTTYTTYEIEKIKYKLHEKYIYYFKEDNGYIHILQNTLDCDMKEAIILIKNKENLLGNYLICRDIQNSSIVLHKFFGSLKYIFESIRDNYINDYMIDNRYEIIGYYCKL